MRNLVLVFLVFTTISCKRNKEVAMEVIELVPERTISQLDTLFFTDVTMFSDSKQNYILSRNPAFLATTDKEFSVLNISSGRGSGPDEFSFPTQGKEYKGVVYVVDQGNQSIKRFNADGGEFISSSRIPEQIFDFRFEIDQEENVYYSIFSPFDDDIILKVDKDGNPIDRFSTSFPVNSEAGENRQVKHFQRDENGNLIVIGASLPFVEMLDPSGKSINRFDIGDVEPIKRSIDSLEYDLSKKPASKSNIPMVILGAQYDKGRLYLAFVDRVGYNRSNARNLLVFKIDENKCQLEKILKFRTGTDDDGFHPSNFHVDSNEGKLYAQGLGTKHIYVFDLPE